MKRLMEKTVFWELVTAWRLAAWPTRRSPLLVNATTEGVVRATSEHGTSQLLAGAEVALCLGLFAACSLHVWLRFKGAVKAVSP